jgi:hypothetical protein
MNAPPIQPRHRIIVAVDVEGSTNRTNFERAQLRDDMYDALEEALRASGVTDDVREPFFDRGDGALVLIHSSDQVPITRLIDTFIPVLNELLELHGATCPERTFRLRVAIHTGVVHFDLRGTYGEDIDITFRMLDDRQLKARLHRTTGLLVLVVSDHIYRSVIRHGYDGIDAGAFEPIVRVEVATQPYLGWVRVPGDEQPVATALSRVDRVS